ncbi:nucleoside-diphosphate kinase [Streptomyces sp. NPDC088725]|uniref:nucleoside-diphosphate kinase n=1 Tax=Streptomyces sp. NPDC088725 TaxID=3365873 RepID=UPI00381C5D47
MSRPFHSGDVVDGIDWDRWSVILCKPDCVRRELVDDVLARFAALPDTTVLGQMDVVVRPWQVHVHYWDMLVDADWYERDIPACLDEMYVGKTVTVALACGPQGTARTLRKLLGYFDPTQAVPGTIRADLGEDSLDAALAHGRLVENLVHTSDDAASARRDFGTWYGARRRSLLTATTPSVPRQPSPSHITEH